MSRSALALRRKNVPVTHIDVGGSFEGAARESGFDLRAADHFAVFVAVFYARASKDGLDGVGAARRVGWWEGPGCRFGSGSVGFWFVGWVVGFCA